LYAAGQFNSYAEASKALLQVQRTGFKSAVIIAYYQAKSVTVANARKLETTAPKATYRISLGSYPQGLPGALTKAIKELSTKDLARIAGEGEAKYVIGPFDTMQEAQTLQQALIDLGFEGIIIEIINP
jgi:cell division protein FtsN